MLINNTQVERSPESSASDTDIVDMSPKAQPAKTKGRKKGRAERALAAIRNLFSPRPKFGAMASREEPLPPTAPGNYTRWVSTLDGTVSYIKTGPLVSMPALN